MGPLIRAHNLGKDIAPEFLRGKILVVDALVIIYQMLAVIRGPDGYFLVDKNKNITSHLVGIFNRECRLMSLGVRSIYVFDGPPHPLKLAVIKRRKEERKRFLGEFLHAVKRGDVEKAIKVGKRAMLLNDQMIEDTKRLLRLLGIPIIQAKHDAEAQASFIVNRGDAFAVATRDWDAIIYGANRVVMHWKIIYDEYLPTKLYTLREILEGLKLTREQLIDLAILLGTDFNPGGFPKVGPKTAYKLIKTYGGVEKLLALKKITWRWPIDYNEIRNIFLNPPVNENYRVEFSSLDRDGLIEFLVNERGFSKQRVLSRLSEAIKGLSRLGKQTSLDSFLRKE